MIKVLNKREGGWTFHYAHFLCDLVLPEIVNGIYKYNIVYRQKNLTQTIGNFYKIWEEIFDTKNEEITEKDYNDLKIETKIISRFDRFNRNIYKKKEFDIFREYMFDKFNIEILNKKYPKILLIERGVDKNLLSDEFKNIEHKEKNGYLSTGKERREIKDIEKLKVELSKYDDYECIMLEGMEIEEQIKYFNNANIIIAAHGAGLSNMLFCKENTTIIEITCNMKWGFFDVISKELSLNHKKCNNNLKSILDLINI